MASRSSFAKSFSPRLRDDLHATAADAAVAVGINEHVKHAWRGGQIKIDSHPAVGAEEVAIRHRLRIRRNKPRDDGGEGSDDRLSGIMRPGGRR